MSKRSSPARAAAFDWRDSVFWIGLAPLVALPLLLNIRVFPFVAPNEEPKWAVLTLCGLWIGLAAGWAAWRAGRLAFRPTWAGLALAVFFLILFIGIRIGPNTVEGAIRFAFWLTSLAVWLVAVWMWRQRPVWRDGMAWSLAIGSLAFSLRYWWSYVMDYGKPGYNVSVLFSPIGHVNFTGDVLVMLLPALVWLLVARPDPVMRVLNWVSVFTASVVLLVAASRGALGGIALGLIVLACMLVRHRATISARARSGRVGLVWLGTALVAALVVNQLLPYHYRELVRVSGTVEAALSEGAGQLTPGAVQPPFADFWARMYPVLTARTPMYASAVAMALDAPWLGQGTGNFYAVYPNWSNRFPDFRDPLSTDRTFTTNPHNIVLQIATQNGIPATVIFLGLLLTFWWRLVRRLWQGWDGWLAAGAVALTAALFDAMFNQVFFNPASMFTFALLGGAWWAALPPMRTLTEQRLPAKPLGVIVAIAAVLLAFWPLRWVASEWHVGKAMMYARVPAVAAAEYQRAYALDPYNFRAVFGVAQAAYQARRFEDAIQRLDEFQAIYPYNPPALNLLGAARMMKGDLDGAEAVFREALRVLPGYKMAEQNLRNLQALRARKAYFKNRR
ncbi:MAG: O-antigen ligase family protein [Mariprofundaceae bacterium]